MNTFPARAGSSTRGLLRALALLMAIVAMLAMQALRPTIASAQSPYGILLNEIDHTTPRAEIAARMDLARAANASWIRLDFYWYSVEWTRGAFNWTYFDTLVQEASARNLSIIATVGWPARWAVTDGNAYYGVPDMAAWENFLSLAAARYRGTVDIWEIWNEPDKPFYWRGTPAKYAELLARAYTRIKAADPGATVAVGGLAQGGSSLVPDFLEQILGNATYPAGRYFDVHNIHTNFRTASLIVSQVSTNRAILSQHGLSKPIIATEASYSSDPAYQTLPGYVGGGEATQARYLVDAYNTMLASGISVAVWATGVDYVDGTGSYAASGLTHSDLRPKPAYTAFRNLAGAPAVPPASVSNLRVANAGSGGRLNVSWTNPGDTDLAGVVVLRRAGSAVTESLATGQSYSSGQTVGASSVVFAGPGTSFSSTGLANGTTYHYRAFAYDSGRLYAGGVSASGVPTATGNQPPVSRPGGPYTGTVNQLIQLNGGGSTDADGAIQSYQWYFGDGTTGTGPTPTHRYAKAGTYRVFLNVTDGSGATASSNTTATIGAGQAPIANPGGPYTGAAGQLIQFNGTGSSDPDGSVQTYQWYFGDGATGTGPRPTHRYARPGTYRVFLDVFDNQGNKATRNTTSTITGP
jgi:chitodextrinase